MDAPTADFAAPSSQELAAAALDDVPVLTERLLAAIFTDNPEWTDYAPVPRADLREACGRYLSRVLEVLGGQVPGPDGDDVAAEIGRHRAEQGVPLEVMLRTFRLGGRIVWEALVERASARGVGPDAVIEAATAMWTVVDGLSSTLSTSYRSTELEQLRRDDQRRHALVEDLLGGRAQDDAFRRRAAEQLDLPLAGSYLVVVAAHGADGRAALRGPQTALGAGGIRSVWQARADTLVGVIALEQRAPATVLERLRPLTRGRAGASPAVAGLAQVGLAHQLALTALGTVPDTAVELVSLPDRLPEALLVASPELRRRLVQDTLGPVLARPPKERDMLLATLTAWLAAECSAGDAAHRLYCHRNTVLNRLQRISALVGRPLTGRRAYVELSLALSALDPPEPVTP
ncbi:PucR family transcriptional regulator [Pseudonocardia nigra]|uniref:PucR family transcriptional regulator n=1 Tax=Pseudonocardia nigra TaxID=1921578 RepID=UPI001C5D43C1|nr:helix-turn-helix domain-containing protein [Pseudonocardia nigra]